MRAFRAAAAATALAVLCVPFCAGAGLAPLHIEGENLVDPSGRPVLLRGVNFGNWLVLESYFYGAKFPDERSLWALVASRFGAQAADQVREAHRANWVTAGDFRRVRGLGFNVVRVPFWSDVLEDPDKPGQWKPGGWKWLDFAVDQCRETGVYCVLDLHGAPGGQSKEDHTGAAGRNKYWNTPQDHARAENIWRAVAARYRGRPEIAAFDLLNEPMGAPSDAAIVSAYDELVAAVRSADPDRLVIVEDAYRGLGLFPTPAAQGWTGVIFSEHHYATMGVTDATPDMTKNYLDRAFPAAAQQQARLGAPVFVGEWNVMDAASGGAPMTRLYVSDMESRGWSWAVWTYKQASAAGVPPDDFWSLYRNPSPTAIPDFAHDTLDAILRKIAGLRTENMTLFSPLAGALQDDGAAKAQTAAAPLQRGAARNANAVFVQTAAGLARP